MFTQSRQFVLRVCTSTVCNGALAIAVAVLAPLHVAQTQTRSSEPAAQPLYMPRAIRKTYEKGTRSMDGRPGKNYWQNRARYSITLTAMPPDRVVRGTEQITYFNNSPDTIRRPNIKLFLNIHKPGATRTGGVDSLYLTPGISVDRYTVNGQPAQWRNEESVFTNRSAPLPSPLPSPLLPHDSVKLSADWHYEISREPNREGMTDSTTWFIAYFYPRVSVYDDYNGWDTMDFTDQQEFYSDFNDYDVSLAVPSNFIVWGTGTLLNAESVLMPDALQRFRASITSDETIRVATHDQLIAKSITRQAPQQTWRFKADNVPDVAFNISDHYDWDAASIVVDEATHRRASVQAAYNDTSSDYRRVVQYARHALDRLSHNWPGVPYPYEKTTVVQGPAGMEYPMMANDESYADTLFSQFVAEHEIAHTYFPFYMGINETRYGFMDEGWTTAFEYGLEQENRGKEAALKFFQDFRVRGWISDPSPSADLPIITPEDMLKNSAYGNNAYGKPALGYLAMRDMLGDAAFGKALHGFMDRWHGRHPIPWDMFNTFNDLTGENLNWFWRSWYFDNSYIDLRLGNVAKKRGRYSLAIGNVGGMPAPVDVRVHYTDGTDESIHETPAIWRVNQKSATVLIPTRKTAQSIELNGGIWMDADTTNNRWSR